MVVWREKMNYPEARIHTATREFASSIFFLIEAIKARVCIVFLKSKNPLRISRIFQTFVTNMSSAYPFHRINVLLVSIFFVLFFINTSLVNIYVSRINTTIWGTAHCFFCFVLTIKNIFVFSILIYCTFSSKIAISVYIFCLSSVFCGNT